MTMITGLSSLTICLLFAIAAVLLIAAAWWGIEEILKKRNLVQFITDEKFRRMKEGE
jgi:hypothetical protein